MQVGCQGEMLHVTKRVHVITMGVACTDPSAGMPDTLLLAAPAAPPAEGLELTRYHLSPSSAFPTLPSVMWGSPRGGVSAHAVCTLTLGGPPLGVPQ